MRNLVLLAIRNGYVLAVLALLGIGFTMYFTHHGAGRSAFFRQTGSIAGQLQERRADWAVYMDLDEQNERLVSEVSRLRIELLSLQGRAGNAPGDWDSTRTGLYNWSVRSGKVVSGPVGSARRLWLAKPGADAGLRRGMGVLWNGYALGVVQEVSDGFSRILPLLHVEGGWSGRLGRDGASGTLSWDGRSSDVMWLGGVPRHVEVVVGDTVFSTGFDGVFPTGIPMGVVEGWTGADVPDFVDVDVRPLVAFDRVRYVHFLEDLRLEEQRDLMDPDANPQTSAQ